MRRIFCGALLLILVAVPWTTAADKKNKAKRPTGGVETKNVGATLPSKLVTQKVARLTEQLDWHYSLDEAKSLAQRENKAVLWLHVLGDLEREC